MSQVMRYFRDKELPGIIKIADGIKTKVDEFAPQVPIVLALRTEGMVDRHWELLTEKIGKEIKPFEAFTFKQCMDMNLIEHENDIVDVGEKAGKE
jgi:dynein heavy chain